MLMRETRQTARNILILVNAVIASGAFILKIVNPIVVNYTEEIRKADLLNFLVFTPVIMIILSLLLYRTLQPVVRLSALGGTMDHEQAQELRTAAFNLPLKVLFLFNLVILSIVGFVALGFDAVFFPFYPFYKRVISMGLIWSYTVCSSLAVYVYVKRRMVPILRSTSGLAADKGRRISIKTSMVATTITLSAMILLFLSVYGYSKAREALIRDDEETANALLYSVKQKTTAHNDLHSLTAFIASQSSGNNVYLVDARGATLAGSPRRTPDSFAAQVLPDRHAVPMDGVEKNSGMRIKRLPLDAPFNGLFLSMAYRIDQEKNAMMRNMTLLFLVIGVFFLFFAGIISYSVGGETSIALADIEKRMKRISEDKETLYEEFEVVSLDEVGDLTRSFNSLQRAIHRQSELIKELEENRHIMEKEKILMDLHDGIGGITTNISILSELAQKETDVEGVKKTLVTISQLSREGISEIRSIMYSLDTKELSWRTMASELRIQGANLVEPHSISFTVETRVDDVQEQPTSLVWVNVFKIYKEALTNVIKHARARSVAVMLKVTADGLLLIIQDDGPGRKSKSAGGRGLSNMWRRAEEIGGRLTLSSESGTRVSLEVPLPIKYPTA
jgi:signal transduction histidine kinase